MDSDDTCDMDPVQGVVLPNGLVVCPCLVHKCSSTTFRRLLLLVLTGVVVENPHYWESTIRAHHIERRPCSATSFNISVVRNPYDRLVSYYKDKYASGVFLPPGMPKGLRLEDFVTRLDGVSPPSTWQLAAAHYAPITSQWSCVRTSQIYKIEDVGRWKYDVFKRLGVTPDHLRRLNRSFVSQRSIPKYRSLLTREMIDRINRFAHSDFDILGYQQLA